MNEILKVSEIKQDATTQPRLKMDMSIVDEYADAMKNGAQFPALVVFKVNEEYILADGYHRLWAAKSAGLKKYLCEVHEGTMRDAVLYASGVNSTHGLRRTNEDKKRAVERLLADPEWGKWSDNKIAEICKVSNHFVGKYRVHTMNIPSMDSQPIDDTRTFIHPKTGKESTMKTGNIGKIKEIDPPQTWRAKEPLEPAPEPEKPTPIPPAAPVVDADKLKRERMEVLAVELLSLYSAPIQTAVADIMREHPSYKVKDVFYFGVQALFEKKSK